MIMIHLHNEDDLRLTGLSVIKFYLEACAPCKRVDTILSKMEKEFQSVKIYSINADNFFNIAKKYEIRNVPTMIFMKDNKEIERVVGMVKTEDCRNAFKKLNG